MEGIKKEKIELEGKLLWYQEKEQESKDLYFVLENKVQNFEDEILNLRKENDFLRQDKNEEKIQILEKEIEVPGNCEKENLEIAILKGENQKKDKKIKRLKTEEKIERICFSVLFLFLLLSLFLKKKKSSFVESV